MNANDRTRQPSSIETTVRGRYSRRAVLRGALATAGAGLLATRGATTFAAPAPAAVPAAAVRAQTETGTGTAAGGAASVFPLPDTRTASPGTEISFRGVDSTALGAIQVTGSQSGTHSGTVRSHRDGVGASYLPDAAFLPGEQVTVTTNLNILGSTDGSFRFGVATAVAQPLPAAAKPPATPPAVQTFRSRPDLKPPAITVATPATKTAPGYVVVGAKTPTGGQSGPMILDNQGQMVWFAPLALASDSVDDVRVQQYRGQPVITWWQGVSAGGHGLGHYVIADTSYQQVATVRVGNGYLGGDLHEFLITPQNTAFFTAYNPVRWDLSSVGGPANGTAFDGIIQEVDVESGRVLFEWHALDHIGLDESYATPPKDATTAFDYFHPNSIAFDLDGNLIISARNTWGIYKLDRQTGDVVWRLGGKKSDFKMGPGTQTAYQHDARIQPNGYLTVFDDGAAPKVEPQSRALMIALDQTAKTATLVRAYTHPGGVLAGSQGNMQVLPNGNVFVGWGDQPVFTEFSGDGTVLFDGRFPTGDYSYRSYRFEWTGLPREAPAVAAAPGPTSDGMTVYASWNGATDVASWQVLAGQSANALQTVLTAPRSGFESAIPVPAAAPYVAVVAQDGAGRVLGASRPVKTSG